MNDLVPAHKFQRAVTLGNASLEFVQTQTIGITVDSVHRYRRNLEEFVLYTSRKGLSPKSVMGYALHLQGKGMSPNRIQETLRTIKRFLTWCFQMGYSTERWHEYVPRIRGTPPKEPKIIGHEEYLKMRSMCETPEQDWLIVCGFSTGFRMGDCCNLKWDRVDQEQMVVAPLLGKTRQSTGASAKIPYNPGGDMHLKLTELWADRPQDEEYVCPLMAESYYCNRKAVAQSMRRVFDWAGIRDRSFKHFRCTFESRLANSGMNIGLAAKITGRSDTRSLLRYIVPDMDAAREGVTKALELHHTNKMFA